jgi:hypothetical protein
MATAAENYYCCFLSGLFQNQNTIVSYTGAAPGMVNGVVQINFQPALFENYYINGNINDSFSVFVAP